MNFPWLGMIFVLKRKRHHRETEMSFVCNAPIATSIDSVKGESPMKSFHHIIASAIVLASATPALAAITFNGSFSVAGAATDLSGLAPAFGGNRLSFGSDLVYDQATDLFYGITDRGPGGGLIDYAPRVNAFRLTFDSNSNAVTGFSLQQTIVFTKADGTAFSGLNPLLRSGNAAILGDSFDPEGFVRLPNGNMLVADEYGPSIYEFDSAGKQIRAFTTPENLKPKRSGGALDYVAGRPDIVNGRQDNRGFEGLTVGANGKVYAIMQDPLVNEGDQGDGRRSRNLRIVEFNATTGVAERQFIYQLDSITDINGRVVAAGGPANSFTATNQGRSIGVSSITALPDGAFLVIERDNRGLGVDDPNAGLVIGQKRVYRIDLSGATDVSAINLAGTSSLGSIVPVNKSLYLDVQAALRAAGENSYEKLEGLAFGPALPGGGFNLILVTDNDFSVTQNGQGTQFDVCTSGAGGTNVQVALGAGCPVGTALIPSRIYSFTATGASIPAVPEPTTWSMMIAGFGLVGAAMRRRLKAAIAYPRPR
jgi:hypothetical protein